ncbi:MAG TPA: ABC transporter permease [Mycobacteriales bacterium]|nr:ABC transporter permease [Mycobacteriales bacterium]HVX69749.1 ABC transporter permease [Mycobacteriales bacterium]
MKTAAREGRAVAVEPGPVVSLGAGISAVAAGQLARVRVARGPLMIVATVQSLGLVILLRGIVHQRDTATAAAVVAGATILVVGFVALNLLAQRLGALKANHALDYYAALPVSPAAVVLGTAASYATFTLPGVLVTAVVGDLVYDLPMARLWFLLPAAATAALALAGVGALLGLLLPRPELATIAGQLGMTVVLFLGLIPVGHLPEVIRGLRLAVPGMLSVDALVDGLRHGSTHWLDAFVRLAAAAAYGAVALAAAGAALRRAVDR